MLPPALIGKACAVVLTQRVQEHVREPLFFHVRERGVSAVHLPVDGRTAHPVAGGKSADRFGARKRLERDGFTFFASQFVRGGSGRLSHEKGAVKNGAPLSPGAPRVAQCVTQLRTTPAGASTGERSSHTRAVARA